MFRFGMTEPLISGAALPILEAVLESGYLSPGGEWTEKFEARLAGECGARYAVACSSGTAALHLALLAVGIGPGDEVIVPALTCPDTLNAVLFVGAKPIIVDVESERYGMNPASLMRAITPRTAAVMPVHLYGAPVDEDVFRVAACHGLLVIEDAAQALGASYVGIKVGIKGDIGCFSFRGEKMVGCGTGGALVTNNQEYADRARHKIGLASIGDGLDRYRSNEVGYSFELSNIMAALAYAQLDVLEPTMRGKQRVATTYGEILKDCFKIRLPVPVAGHVFWKYAPVFMAANGLQPIFDAFIERGIEVTPPFVPAYELPMYEDPSEGEWATWFPNSVFLGRRILGLPSSPNLTLGDLEEISQIVLEIVREIP